MQCCQIYTYVINNHLLIEHPCELHNKYTTLLYIILFTYLPIMSTKIYFWPVVNQSTKLFQEVKTSNTHALGIICIIFVCLIELRKSILYLFNRISPYQPKSESRSRSISYRLQVIVLRPFYEAENTEHVSVPIFRPNKFSIIFRHKYF